MIEAFVRDLRFAARGLRRTPSFFAATALTLAIGIGATTAVFSVVYGVLFRPLPFPTADRLVQIVQLLPSRDGGPPARAGLTQDQIAEWRATSRTFAEIGFYGPTSMSLTGVAVPLRLNGAQIAVPLFRALGVAPLMGRPFLAEDELHGNEQVVMLAYTTWSSRFANAPDIIDRTIELNGRLYRVIGVMPPGFGFPSLARPGMSMNADGELSDAPEFWTPIVKGSRPTGPATGGMTLVPTFALLRAGVTLPQAAAEANALMPAHVGERFAIELVAAGVEQTRAVKRILLVFQAAVLFVLFIACANLMNLLLARAASRRREVAVRLAIGASHAQVVRYAVTESVIIGVVGGAAGCCLAWLAVTSIRALPPYVLPRLSDIRVDRLALGMAAATALGSSALVGLWTGARILTGERADRSIWRPQRDQERRHQPSRVLVIAETGAGVMLLAGAALLLGSFLKLTQVDRGFDASNVYSFRVSLPPRLQTPQAQIGFYDRLTAELRSMPGVKSVSATAGSFGGTSIGFDLTIAGRTTRDNIHFQAIAPGLQETLHIPLQGRDLSASDGTPTARSVIVNQAFAQKYFRDRDPVGQMLDFQDWKALSIVGVAGDIRTAALTTAVPPTIYFPMEAKTGFPGPNYFVRTDRTNPGLLASVRAATSRLDHDAVIYDAAPLQTLLDRQVVTPRFYGLTASGFAVVAVALAALGLYGVLSYTVSVRTRELGIRIALGATSGRVIGEVMRQAAVTVCLGVTGGLAGALWSARFLESLLFGVQPESPSILAAVAATFLAVALIAAYVPARRATRVDPIAALRAE